MEKTVQQLNKIALGAEIKRIRLARNLTQDAVASHFNWDKQVISDIETGKAISLVKLILLSNYFEVSLDSFKDIALSL